MTEQSEQTRAPLAGFRVLDFTRVVAGPNCAMQLGDLGAEVWKVEHPVGGDDTRHWGEPKVGGESFYYLAYNRNKKSLVLDLSKPEGREIAQSDWRRRIRQPEHDRLCPYVYKVWAAGLDGDQRVAAEFLAIEL